MQYPKHLAKLMALLRRLPGVGARTAERYAFRLLAWSEQEAAEFADVVRTIPKRLALCGECGCLTDEQGCLFCQAPHREQQTLCIVASPKDVFSIEATGFYRGVYHVLGGLLSPLDGRGAEKLQLPKLQARVSQLGIDEVILALDATVEGDATALFLKRELAGPNRKISRLAFGIPMGSSLDYVDGSTIARALAGRASF